MKTTSKTAPKRPIEILTSAEVRHLLTQCSARAPTGLRDAALIAVLYRGGLRLAEALALYPRDLNGERGTVRIHNGKGHKPRTVGLDATAFGLIERWRRVRDQRGFEPRTTPLFCTLGGRALAPRAVQAMLTRRANKAGITKRVHPHGLRHAHAMELITDERIPLNALQRQLGHSNLTTTALYVNHLGADDVIAIGRERADW